MFHFGHYKFTNISKVSNATILLVSDQFHLHFRDIKTLFPKLDQLCFDKINVTNEDCFNRKLFQLTQYKKPLQVLCLNFSGIFEFINYFQIKPKSKQDHVVVDRLIIEDVSSRFTIDIIKKISTIFKINHLKIDYRCHNLTPYSGSDPLEIKKVCEHFMEFKTFSGHGINRLFTSNIAIISEIEWIKKHYKWFHINGHLFDKEFNDVVLNIKKIIEKQERLVTFCMGLDPSSQSSINLSLVQNYYYDGPNLLPIVFNYV